MHITYISKMSEPLPKWEMKKYAILWRMFGKRKFTNKKAQETLKENKNHILSVLFYDLRKTGWIEIVRDGKDQRKKKYKLKEPNRVVKELMS